MNDNHRDHIYPHLHGTGGIGPGDWDKSRLATQQETHTALLKVRAGAITAKVITLHHALCSFEEIRAVVLTML